MRTRTKNALPYEHATSGSKALAELERVLRAFGVSTFGSHTDYEQGRLIVQFTHRGRNVAVEASSRGYAAAWLIAHPHNSRMRMSRAQHEAEALRVGSIAVCSIVRDWIKGQVAAVEAGVLSFEHVFLSHILLSSGATVLGHLNTMHVLPAEAGE